jgi:hypothetical protein
MSCLIILVVLAMGILAALTLHQRYHRRLTFRWWGLVLLAVFALASFPLSIDTTLYFLIQSKLMGPYELALWITDAWRQNGRYVAVVWLIGFPLVILLKGVAFTTRADAIRSIAAVILIMLPLTVIDSSLFWVGNRAENRHQWTAVSPDGRLRATATVTNRRDDCRYTLACEDNVPHPWLARPLTSLTAPRDLITVSADGSGPDPASPWAGVRLVWSKDSAVVCLLGVGDFALFAYDFSRDQALSVLNPQQESARPEGFYVSEFKDVVDRLISEHGGLALPNP